MVSLVAGNGVSDQLTAPVLDLVPALGCPLRSEQVAQASPTNPACRDHSIMGNHPTASPSGRRAFNLTPARQARKDFP